MAWALVGTIGTAVQSTAGNSASPSWGASENRTAGNLLVLFCSITKSATLPTTPAGWNIAKQVAGTSTSATIFYKTATGSDAAPTISGITSALIAAQLAEYSGAISSTANQTGSATGTSSPVTATNAGASAATSQLLLIASGDTRSVNRASNDTLTSNHVTSVTAAGNNNGVSSQSHYSFGYGTTNSISGADTAVVTLSITTSITGVAIVDAVFGLGATYVKSLTLDAVIDRVTSTEDWHISPSAPSVPGGFLLRTTYGNGYYVGGTTAGVVRYATNPAGPWSTNSTGIGSNFGMVAYGNGYWVAIGSSSSGLWYRATDPTGAFTSNYPGVPFNFVTYANGYWVGLATGGVLYYATDPTGTWTANNQGSNTFLSIAYGNGYWVAVAQNDTNFNILYRATDPTGAFTANDQPAASGSATDVTYANGYWVAVGGNSGSNGKIVYKAGDPTGTWSVVTSGADLFLSVASSGDDWVAAGNFPRLASAPSPSGPWTTIATTGYSSINFYVVNGGGWYVTTGGTMWARTATGDGMTVNAVLAAAASKSLPPAPYIPRAYRSLLPR